MVIPFLVFTLGISIQLGLAVVPIKSQPEHLIVLSHGLMGRPTDLDYLAGLLISQQGSLVLQSKANEYINSLKGIPFGAKKLAEEIISFKNQNPSVKNISFVGNSLGGLYARYALKLLHNSSDNSICGLTPHKFMTIATQHLGVRDFNILDDCGIIYIDKELKDIPVIHTQPEYEWEAK